MSQDGQINQIIKAKEARHVVYVKSPDNEAPDLHVIKEQIHNEDGTTTPNLRLVQDYKRPFWVTKKGFRNHQQWKEWESIERLNKFETTQRNLFNAASKALETPWVKGGMRDLSNSPYLYGTDISSSAIIKQGYDKRFAKPATPYSVAVCDTETDVVHGHGDIMIATVTYKNRAITAIDKRFVEGYTDVINRVKELAESLIGDVLKKRGIELDLRIVDNPVAVIKTVIDKAHEWKPDYLTFWNIDFDIGKMMSACEKYDGDMGDIFSDPSIPKGYRTFEFIEGQRQKVTASGKATPIKPVAQWHSAVAPATFYMVDSMRVYRQIRTGQQEKPSYALDALLEEEKIGITKLKFEQADHIKHNKLKWHELMQSKFPLHYIVYNIIDCIAVEMFDEKTKDLQITLPMYGGCSDTTRFNSQPRRKVDDMHWYCLENNHVIGTTGSNMITDQDGMVRPLTGWITALNAHQITMQGLRCVKENKRLNTRIYVHIGDLDVRAAYPSNQIAFNVSKETTVTEVTDITGIPYETQCMQGINLSSGQTNAAEFCQTMLGFPEFEELLAAFA